jgi:hypothetical protein
VVLTTSSFISFIFFEVLRMAGVLTNAYAGLITYLLFPALFVIGLILIPIGWHTYRKQKKMSTHELLNQRFGEETVMGGLSGSRFFRTILIFTLINVLFISLASFRTLKFMDQPNFCGTACHQVMGPEWTTYQVSPHARVKCVECHVGDGMKALINSKLSGMRQMWKSTFNTFERPVPTPVHELRPSRETCEKCHWPEKFYGSRLKVIHRYATDEKSTPHYVTLNLKVDTGQQATKAGIHWHIHQENEVRYASVDDQRLEMLWVDVKQRDGTFNRFTNQNLTGFSEGKDWKHVRTMDCVDCHNRATHIYEEPEKALDERIAKGQVDLSLPFAKRTMLAAIMPNYPNKNAAYDGIADYIQGYYRRKHPNITRAKLNQVEQMVETAREVYARNVHPDMKVEWGTYPSFLGHDRDTGCFRCHNENMRDEKGNMIAYDCTLCHSILSYKENEAFKYLHTPEKKSPNYKMHKMLREEFLNSSNK